MEELERRLQEQAAALSARIAELDTDNRKLRDQKYELDTRVCRRCCLRRLLPPLLHVAAAAAAAARCRTSS
jgi:hypothetical protein